MDFVAHDLGVAATRFSKAMTQAVTEALVGSGLSRSEYGALDYIQRNPGISNAELARYLRITPQALGRLTKRLIDRGLVEAATGGPGRRQPIAPSAAGRELYERTRPLVEAVLQGLLAELAAPERHALLKMLIVVADASDARMTLQGAKRPADDGDA